MREKVQELKRSGQACGECPRLLPQDEGVAGQVPSVVRGVAEQVASFLYTFLAIKGECAEVA